MSRAEMSSSSRIPEFQEETREAKKQDRHTTTTPPETESAVPDERHGCYSHGDLDILKTCGLRWRT